VSFRAIVVDKRDADSLPEASIRDLDDGYFDEFPAGSTDDASDAVVLIDVQYSSVNFKDGLALMGKPGVIRDYPLIPGIDLVGVVRESDSEWFRQGDAVVLNGDGIGERRNGGLAERARVRRDALVALPDGITAVRAAAIGTAGFTAMLAVLELEDQGVTPADGEVLVTGAAGGVGSLATSLLAGRGFSVTASTGRREEEADFLHRLGAKSIIDRNELSQPGKPLQSQRWAAAVDSVGSHTLANVLAQTNYGGIVISCGLAQGSDLPTTVMPFILRQVSLIGANSVEAPLELRERAWQALADELDPALLDELTTVVPLGEAVVVAERILAGRVRGRTVVDVRA
jgi:acrylyl-CoA reductase (NADPH)